MSKGFGWQATAGASQVEACDQPEVTIAHSGAQAGSFRTGEVLPENLVGAPVLIRFGAHVTVQMLRSPAPERMGAGEAVPLGVLSAAH